MKLLGTIAGVGNLVPFIGPILGGVPAVVIALATRDLGTALWAAGIMTVVQQIESYLLSPLVMRRTTRIHPVVAMLAIMVGAVLFGIPGMLLAVPGRLLACAVCLTGAGNDPVQDAFNWSVLFLMAAPYTIAGSIAAWLVYLHRRSLPRKHGPGFRWGGLQKGVEK